MSKLIVVCGYPGAGKTTLAKRLSTELKIGCLHKDSLKENLYELENCSTLEESVKLGIVSIKLLFALMEENIKNKVDLIIEAPFNFEEDQIFFKDLIKIYNIEFYCVICSVDEKIRQKRFVERERHTAHHDTERLEKIDTERYKPRRFDFSKMPERKIWIDTSKSIDENLKEVLTIIK
ncbi:MAG: ATP-binding protein [Patescibacteria group bacterium]